MVYDWEGKEEKMMDLYINQGKSLEEVMEWFKVNEQFTPSKRAFQTQIKRWHFPSKHIPNHTDPNLVERVRQLWAKNVSQKDMLATIHQEGHRNMSERELSRIRDKEGLRLRVAGFKVTPKKALDSASSKRKRDADDKQVTPNEDDVQPEDGNQESPVLPITLQPQPQLELSDEVLQKREAWHQRLQAESLERLEKRTRRRRTKVYAGLPPDPPAPPRFPSETTLEEAKGILQLDKPMYNSLRMKFEEICIQHNVVKKTEAGHDKWQGVKHQLIDEYPPIQPFFQVPDEQQLNNHYLALEMICNDVTKKLRTMKSKVTIADAKNVLGLNPEQGREIKAAFLQILKKDHFTSKLESGPEHWQELKRQWIDGLPVLQSVLAPGEADPLHSQKVKATEHLCRDVMKRHRDGQTRAEKMRKPSDVVDQNHVREAVTTSRPIPPPVSPYQAHPNAPAVQDYNGISTLASQALASAPLPISPPLATRQQQSRPEYNSQIDPTLLSAAANLPYQPPPQHEAPIPVYFRLAPDSEVKPPPLVWVETLTAPSLSALHQVAVSNRPYTNLRIDRVEGLIKTEGSETKLTIGDDDELMAYLNHVKKETPTFIVHLSFAS
ncbi:MAG: hypothetical protein Q9220_005239 [cf. Caloplaca sp. 1 TL-2023]